MNEQNKSSKTNKKLVVFHIITSAIFITLAVIIVKFLLSLSIIDGIGFGIFFGILFGFISVALYFGVESIVPAFIDIELDTHVGTIISSIFKCFVAIFIVIYTINSPNTVDNTIGYKSGDYSQYSCEDCGKPADGGRWYVSSKPTQYYCNEHYLEHKQWSDEYEEGYTCRVCHREFRSGSDNAQSIRRSNMCINCYNNFKSMQGVLE